MGNEGRGDDALTGRAMKHRVEAACASRKNVGGDQLQCETHVFNSKDGGSSPSSARRAVMRRSYEAGFAAYSSMVDEQINEAVRMPCRDTEPVRDVSRRDHGVRKTPQLLGKQRQSFRHFVNCPQIGATTSSGPPVLSGGARSQNLLGEAQGPVPRKASHSGPARELLDG